MSDPDSSLDFRRSMIKRRLRRVGRIILVVSGKGGVGKSVLSATFAALLAGAGLRVGLMDADIYGPSSALLLGAKGPPEEGRQGLIPPTIHGVKIMSVDLFAPGRPIPLTGTGARQVILEMLALTAWGDLDYLVVDMPPATNDIMMTWTSLDVKRLAALVVTMPDRLSLAVAHRVLQLLRAGEIPVAGLLGNMHQRSQHEGRQEKGGPRRLAREFDVAFWGRLPYDAGVPRAVDEGDMKRLLGTRFAAVLRRAVKAHLKPSGFAARGAQTLPT